MSEDKLTLAEKKRRVTALMNKLNPKDGPPVLAYANQVPNPFYLRRPSGIMALDIDCAGGLPAGGLSYLSGPDGAGKTMLLYRYFAMQQRLHGANCYLALAPTESAPDYWFMRKCGMKVAIPDDNIEEMDEDRKRRGLPPFTKEERASFKEQTGHFSLILGQTSEEILDHLYEVIMSGVFNIAALDSVSAICSSSEWAKETLEKNPQQAANAGLLTRFMQRYHPLTTGYGGRNETTVIFTSQVRSNRSKADAPGHIQKYLKDWAPTGAWAAKHAKLFDIVISPGEKLRAKKKFEGEAGEVIGKEVRWELIKGKAGAHENTRGEINMTYEHGIDTVGNIIDCGMQWGAIIEKAGKLTVRTEGGTAPVIENISSVEKLREMLTTDSVFEMAVRREVLAAANINCKYA